MENYPYLDLCECELVDSSNPCSAVTIDNTNTTQQETITMLNKIKEAVTYIFMATMLLAIFSCVQFVIWVTPDTMGQKKS